MVIRITAEYKAHIFLLTIYKYQYHIFMNQEKCIIYIC